MVNSTILVIDRSRTLAALGRCPLYLNIWQDLVKGIPVNYRLLKIVMLTFFSTTTLLVTEQTITAPPTAHAQVDFNCAIVGQIPQIECEALVVIANTN